MENKNLLYMVYQTAQRRGKWVRVGTPVRRGVVEVLDGSPWLPVTKPLDDDQARKKQEPGPPLTRSRQVRLGKDVFAAIKANDKHPNVSSFVRSVLSDYLRGSVVVGTEQSPARRPVTIRMDEELAAFWDSLPKGTRLDMLGAMFRAELGGAVAETQELAAPETPRT